MGKGKVYLAGDSKVTPFTAHLSVNHCVCVVDEVPGSAVLVFDIELVEMEDGLPEGYMFIWNDDVSNDLFTEMDKDQNKEVEPSEVRDDLPQHLGHLQTFFLPVCSCPLITNVPHPLPFWLPQFTDYIMKQVNEGKGRLAPGFDPYRIIDNMFSNQDRDGDGKITEAEFKLKADEDVSHDEL